MAKSKLTFVDQIRVVLDEIVPYEIHVQAAQEVMACNIADHQSAIGAGIRAKQHFIDFFAEAFAGRAEITPKAIEDAAIYMTLGTVELFKRATLISMGGFGPDVPLDKPLVRH
jgi:hypothetical protein